MLEKQRTARRVLDARQGLGNRMARSCDLAVREEEDAQEVVSREDKRGPSSMSPTRAIVVWAAEEREEATNMQRAAVER